jgi:leucyl aminopeptidase
MEVLFQNEGKNKLFFCFKNSPSIPEDFIKNKLFNGDKETSYVTVQNETEVIMWVGLGEKETSSPFNLYHSGVHAIEKVVMPRKIDNIKVHFAQELEQDNIFFLAEGVLCAALYTYTMKSEQLNGRVDLSHIVFEGPQAVIQTAHLVAQARNITKELIDTPPNYMYPQTFANYVQENLGKLGIDVEIWDRKKLEEEKMEGILNVGKGSDHEPCLIKMTYLPHNARKSICLIGKGISYDTGGYSLKPNDGMKSMKSDLGGGAAVVGILFGIASLNLQIATTAYIPLAENMVNGSAYRPGDVIKYRNGTTVEITNADAEGRLVLADALILACEQEFDLIVDMATLTGAIAVALGDKIHGVFYNTKASNYAQSYVQFSQDKASDPAWRMPLFEDYKSALRSGIADMQNTGGKTGGAINAALFLSSFVKESQAWMHLDIAGTSFDNNKNFTGKATGSPVETMLLFLATQFLEVS